MPLPIQHQALQEIRAAQERRVRRRTAAHHHVVAAAGAGMPAIDQKAIGAEPDLCRLLIEMHRGIDRFAPVRGRMNVDFDHAGIRRHLDHLDAGIERRRVALDMDLELHLFGGGLHRGDQFQIVFQLLHLRHEGAQDAVADFNRHRGTHAAGPDLLLLHLLVRRALGMRGVIDRQRLARLQGILLDHVGIVILRDMRQRGDRQPQPERRIARREKQIAAPQLPALAAPAGVGGVPALDRQHETARHIEPALEHPRHPGALFEIGQFRIAGRDVRRQAGFLLLPVFRILERRQDEFGGNAKSGGSGFGKALGLPDIGPARPFDLRDQIRILPDRHAILSPGYHLPCP